MTFDAAMTAYEETSPIGTIADSFPITLPAEASSRPATASPDAGTSDHAITVYNANTLVHVNTAKPRKWRLVRMPEGLAVRLERLSGEMHAAYVEGRVTLPGSMAEAVPMWAVVENALDEQEARRARSNRPRRKQS
jgi:hypothetical protein